LPEEEIRRIEFNAVRDTDEADIAAAPRPEVISFTRSIASSPRSATMSVAPNSRASLCRDSCLLIEGTAGVAQAFSEVR